MTIFFILPDLSAGGAERVSITIARILSKEGYDVEFINLGKERGEMLSWIEPEFKMISFGCTRVLYAIPKLCSFMNAHSDSQFFSSREHVNVVGLLAAKISRIQMVVRIPNMPNNVLTKGLSGLKMRLIKRINQYLLKTAKHVIAQNAEMRTQLLDYYSLSSDKVVVINNPVDRDHILASAEGSTNLFPKDEVSLLNVCNIAYSKGIDILEDAWPRVKDVIPNAHMYIIGRNTSEYAQNLVKRSGNLKDFTFLGFINNPYPYIKHCDIFVLPSRMEGFPNVVLEAMCFNRPIASTTCVNIIKDIIKEGNNGYYCNTESPDDLADAIIKASKLSSINNTYDLFDKNQLISLFK